MENELNKREELFCISMEKAIISYTPEPAWQNMLQDQPQKIRSRQGSELCLSAIAVHIFERNESIFICDDILLADNSTVDIWTDT